MKKYMFFAAVFYSLAALLPSCSNKELYLEPPFQGYKGNPSMVKDYHYDYSMKFGKVEKGEFRGLHVYKYDQNGHETSFVGYDESGDTLVFGVSEYTSMGNLKYRSDHVSTKFYEYSFEAKDKLCRTVSVNSDISGISETYGEDVFYDYKAKTITVYESNKPYYVIYQFNDFGQVVSAKTINKETGQIKQESLSQYNDKGFLILFDASGSLPGYKYELTHLKYDKVGNPTQGYVFYLDPKYRFYSYYYEREYVY